MTEAPIALRADDVETLSSSCPARFEGFDVATGDLVELRYSSHVLRVTRGHREVFEGDVPEGRHGEACDLADACRAAGIDLLGPGDAPPTVLVAADVEVTCEACPSQFSGRDVATGDEVTLRYRGWNLTVTRAFRETYSGPVDDARSDGVCTLEQACRASGVRLVR